MKPFFLKKGTHRKNSGDRLAPLMRLWRFTLLAVGLAACFLSYSQRREKVISEMDGIFVRLEKEYTDMLDNFWQIYMPMFENGQDAYRILSVYFASDAAADLSPFEKLELSDALRQMISRDNQVQWIALLSQVRDVNYILAQGENGLQILSEDFPYKEDIASGSRRMDVYGLRSVISSAETFAICGGIPDRMGKGNILAGYSIASFEQICRNASLPLDGAEFTLLNNGQILYASDGNYEKDAALYPAATESGIRLAESGRSAYTRSKVIGNNTSVLCYQIPRIKLFLYAHALTPLILSVILVFILLSVKLKENIDRAYYYELRQKESELSSLQSKFNPHFLYNSLEMLRSRCISGGDTDTAELITRLAAIFRGFISSKTFVSLQEELNFSRQYLSLFDARYGNRIEIQYDIDTELLQYGVIRNILQPLIENYFVHGLDVSSETSHYIRIRGESVDERLMLLAVEDNGSGMTSEEIKRLNESFRESATAPGESYGLKNLHQRLRLYYGEDCGLTVFPNGEKGLSVQMTLLKMHCKETQP